MKHCYKWDDLLEGHKQRLQNQKWKFTIVCFFFVWLYVWLETADT
jgi:hypothetical protein